MILRKQLDVRSYSADIVESATLVSIVPEDLPDH